MGEESTCNAGHAGDAGSIPGWGRSPEGGHGNPLQYSCLENLMDRVAWRAVFHGGCKVSDMAEEAFTIKASIKSYRKKN